MSPRWRVLSWALPALLALLAFGGAWHGGFVYDDHAAIVDQRAIHEHDGWRAAFGDVHTPIANRPLVCWSFVLDHALFGLAPAGWHLVNVLLHAVNAALLALVLRAALRARNVASAFPPARAALLALSIASVWAVHPLATDAVAYATQRSTLLMSTCLLVACLGLLRGATAARPAAAHAVAVLALALGMACKEELAFAPVLLLLFDRAFLQPSWAAVRRRWRLHAGFAASWAVLLACVAAGPHNPTVGSGNVLRTGALDWLCTQAAVLVHYLRLSLVPWPLRGAYDWPIVRDVGRAALPGALVLGLLIATVLAWRRRPRLGFAGAWFFLLLAPTSSVLPIVTEVVAERRAYLPMLAVLAPLLAAAEALARRLAGRSWPLWLVLLPLLAAGIAAARARTAVYADEAAFWTDAYQKNALATNSFQAANILSNYGLVLRQQGRAAEARALFARAMQCEAPTPIERLHYAVSLAEQGQTTAAEPLLREVVRDDPRLPEARANLANVLLQQVIAAAGSGSWPAQDPRLVEAEQLLRAAIALDADRGAFHNTLGLLLARTGRADAAAASYRRAVALDPARPEPVTGLVGVLLAAGRADAARTAMQPSLQAAPHDAALRLQLAAEFLRQHQDEVGIELLQQVLQIEPAHAQARAVLDELTATKR